MKALYALYMHGEEQRNHLSIHMTTVRRDRIRLRSLVSFLICLLSKNEIAYPAILTCWPVFSVGTIPELKSDQQQFKRSDCLGLLLEKEMVTVLSRK